MYKKNQLAKTTISRNTSYNGETIEGKIRRILSNKEPITDGAPMVYTERKDGVRPEHNIRTDRFEVAVEATSIIDGAHKARREDRHKSDEQKATEKKQRDIEKAKKKANEIRDNQTLKDFGTEGESGA